MRLTVLGCSGSMSSPESASSSYLVQADDAERTYSMVLDLGSGAMGQLLRYHDPAALDAVLLSHLHADHVVDLAALHVYLQYGPAGPQPPMPVHGPAGTTERIRQLCGEEDCDEQFDVGTWQPGTALQVGPMTIEVFEVRHPVTAYALRVTGPSEDGSGPVVLTYTGDTDSCTGVIDAAREADLLLSEAAFWEDGPPIRGLHLTGRRAGEVATAADARHLVLTHLQPWTPAETVRAEALTAFSGPVDLAAPGAVWEL
ncbi:MAG TPA: MBL fold metallo-hydrolase [Ruania sp.]|nr:MBL fold metallo-hydrolase [Ruania sp.]